jgi:O-antigen/teichoic acid export membrane protein
MRRFSVSDKVGILFSSQIVVQGLQILDGILLARLLTRADFATYGQTWLVVALLMPIFGNLGGGSAYFLPRLDRGRQKGFIAQSISTGLLAGAAASVGIWVAADFVGARFSNPELSGLLKVFCLFPLLAFPGYFFGQFTISVERNVFGAAAGAVNKAVHTVVFATTILLGGSLQTLFVAMLIQTGLSLLFFTGYAAWFYRDVKMIWDSSLLRGQLSYTIPIALAAATGVINRELDKLVISSFFLPTMVAVYMVGAKEVPVMALVGGAISNVLVPEMSREHACGNMARVRELWSESMRKQAMAAIPAFVFLMAFAPEFIITLYGREYAESATVFRVYLLVLPMRAIIWSLVLTATGHTRSLTWGAVIALCSNVLVSIGATLLIGMPGAALGTVVSIACSAAFYAWRSRVLTGLHPLACFPWRPAGGITVISLCACACVWALKYVPCRTELVFALGSVGFTVIFAVVLLRTRLLTAYERTILRRWATLGLLR